MAIRMSVSSPGLSRVGRVNWRAAVERWADEVGPVVRNEIRDHTPVAQASGGGRLRDSVRYTRHTTSSSVVAEFTTSVPYARYVVGGTPPHIIRPRNARALRWTGRSGESLFARQVNHPGTSPNDFPRRAVQSLLPMLQAKFAEITEQSIKEGAP